ncbi:MAG: nucleoside triphosphate pyrophosphohydrolase [Porticoccaceae bacterium]|nr:MAG: nucleoside triphosphate pyrophosphohydrolase [Porticoccaceae bacterium]
MADEGYEVEALLEVMARLRDPQTGCPWDRAQDFASLVPYLLEETYEVIDAIERADWRQLPEELGDLLLQVVFHAQIGSERGLFDFSGIVDRLVRKLITRHPHVFPDGTLASRGAGEHEMAELAASWRESKARERRARGNPSVFDGVPAAAPALLRAQKLQQRAAELGLDWNSAQGVFDKVCEELGELRAEVERGDARRAGEELGDLLFAVVNLARHLGVDAETALRRSAEKFARRARAVEEKLAARGERTAPIDAGELDLLWRQAKESEGGGGGL